MRFIECGGDNLVAAAHGAQRYVRRELTTGIRQTFWRVERNTASGREFHEGSGDSASLLVVHLYDERLRQRGSSLRKLFSATGLDDRRAKRGRLGRWRSLAPASA